MMRDVVRSLLFSLRQRFLEALKFFFPALYAIFLLSGCATYNRQGLDPKTAAEIEKTRVHRELTLPRELEDKVLRLNPEHVTEKDIRDVLSHTPAPRKPVPRAGRIDR